MINHGYANIPVLEEGDAPDWPGYLAQMVDATDPHLVQHVADVNERNTRLVNAPPGTVAASTTDGSLWFRTATGWVTWWEPVEAWRTLTLAAGYSPGTACQVRRIGNQVWLRGRFNNDNGAVPLNGDKVATVPADCIPVQIATVAVGVTLAGTNEVPTGRLEVYSQTTNSSEGGPGSVLLFLGAEQTNVGWAAFGGTYWID